jgi:hypothetical protein
MIYISFSILFSILVLFEKNIGGGNTFVIKSFLLTAFVLYEITKIIDKKDLRTFFNPYVAACIITFIFGFGITNLIYIIPNEFYDNLIYISFGPYAFDSLNNAMDSAILAAVAMTIGYKTNLGNSLYTFLFIKNYKLLKYLRNSFKLNFLFFNISVISSVAARLYAIYMGVYGYSSTTAALQAASNISQILYYAGNIGLLNLIVISVLYLKNRNDGRIKLLFYIVLIVELLFGVLSGSKSPIVLPVLIMFSTYIFINNRIKKTYIILTIFLIFFAYAIIEPFRSIRSQDLAYESNPSYIIETMEYSYKMNKGRQLAEEVNPTSVFMRFLSRQNYILDAAKAIEYANKFKLGKEDPDFRYRLISIPLQAYVPRMFWPGKSEENIGGWFAQKVWARPPGTSIAMTPIGFLYFSGGNILIFFFFVIFGILQKFLANFMNKGVGSLIIFLALLLTLAQIDSVVNGMFVSLLRTIPFLIIYQALILKK